MNSLAIWHNNTSLVNIEELHLNYWSSNNESTNYLEIAFLISDHQDEMTLTLFVPFFISDKAFIADKTKKLANSIELSSAMFNEQLTIKTIEGQFAFVEFPDKNLEKNFYYYLPNEDNDITLNNKKTDGSPNHEGSNIIIKVPKKDKKEKIYFRIRISAPKNLYKNKLNGNFFQDGFFKKTSFLEININSIRKLPSHIVQNLDKKNKIKKIQVFVMTDIFNEVSFSNHDIKSSRILENHIWDDYIDNRDIDRVIAHQWTHKNDEGMNDYNLFIISKQLHFTKSNIFFTAFFILIFSIFIEISASYISDFFQQKQEVDINATKQ